MSETNGSVLNFTRDAAFINRRAQLRRDSGDDMEALRLFRRACAEAPDRLDYRVDVAEMLNCMGCVRASYYEIVDIINDGLLDGADASDDAGYMEAVGAALFGQACNLSSLGFAASAIDLINRARRYPRDEADMDSLNELYTQLIARELTPNGLHTKERFIRKLHMYAESGNTRRAYALARRYLKHNDKRPLAHAAMAWAEMLRGNQPESMEHLVRALAMTKRDPWVLSIAARILIAGERGQAQPALESAFAVSEGPECDEVLLRQAIVLGMDYLALDISGRLLENAPGDPYFSAYNAAALINTGASARSALNVMRRSLDIYPGDITTRHYVKLISDTMPDCAPIKYPDQEMLEAWARTVADLRIMLIASAGGVIPKYDDEMTDTLEWGLYFRDDDISASSAAMLAHAGSERARKALWRFLASYDSSDDHRIAAMELMSASDMALPRLIFLRDKLRPLNETTLCRIMAQSESRLDIRVAARRLREHPEAIVSLRTLAFFSEGSGQDARLNANALECAYRITHGEALNLRTIAKKRRINCAKFTRAVYSLIHISHPQEDLQ